MHGLFFTGTDTGVGKTLVTAFVARLLRQQGRAVRVSKPVATGASLLSGRWVSADTLDLAAAAGSDELDQITPFAFPDPLAPPVAAQRQGVELTLAQLVAVARNQSRPDAVILVEGVGGLLCPLTRQETVADLAGQLALPLVVVARRSLGTLNHTLLTLEVARHRGLKVAGIVVNETCPSRSLADETNVEELRQRLDVPILAVIPFLAEAQRQDPAPLGAIDWWRLCA